MWFEINWVTYLKRQTYVWTIGLISFYYAKMWNIKKWMKLTWPFSGHSAEFYKEVFVDLTNLIDSSQQMNK